MDKTSRRTMLLRAATLGGVATGLGVISRATSTNAQGAHEHGEAPTGPLASATVSFGQWPTDPPFDRFPNVRPTPTQNVHHLTPNLVTIKAGGAVNFVIAGLHNVQIFLPGKEAEDVNTGLVTPMTAPPGLPIINDPVGRVYRGPDPSLLPLDRTESVSLSTVGTHLVICGFLFHFQEGMYGYIKVVP